MHVCTAAQILQWWGVEGCENVDVVWGAGCGVHSSNSWKFDGAWLTVIMAIERERRSAAML
jgi:hypothetical protein